MPDRFNLRIETADGHIHVGIQGKGTKERLCLNGERIIGLKSHDRAKVAPAVEALHDDFVEAGLIHNPQH